MSGCSLVPDYVLSREEKHALIAMLGTSWTCEGAIVRRLTELGLVHWNGSGHRLTDRGREAAIAFVRLARASREAS